MPKQRQRIYEQYEGLIGPMAGSVRRALPPSLDIEDLLQVGRIALWQAAGKYRRKDAPTFGFYVRMRIRGAMIDSIRGRAYREATHRELPPVLQISDGRPTIEQRMIAQDGAIAERDARRGQLRLIRGAMDDADPKFMPLTQRNKKVIEMRFTGGGMTQETAARKLGVRQQSLQQMESRTLGILRMKAAA